MNEDVIMVDPYDHQIGIMEKMEAHRSGTLHRAISIILFNERGEMFLQKRAKGKYHSAGLWSNACCSHPRPGEHTNEAAIRRTKEELGIDVTLTFAYSFIYKATLDNNLIEHELDHVYIGRADGGFNINPDEIEDWKYLSVDKIREEINIDPSLYTYWFKIIIAQNKFCQPV